LGFWYDGNRMKVITRGLRFPEGPVALADGSILVVEIERGTLTMVHPDGRQQVVARPGGGPNGAAIGPDGACYICNNGGFSWANSDIGLRPIGIPDDYAGGRIERIDLRAGTVERLYDRAGDRQLRGPNDLVFDRHGGLWFTDAGKFDNNGRDFGAVCYAPSDGSRCIRAAAPMISPNGIGLSPDETILYVAETMTARLWAFDLAAPGVIRRNDNGTPHGGRMLFASPVYQSFDSLAVDSEGNICVATLVTGGITVISPVGQQLDFVKCPDPQTTNICFGGADLRTAFVTLGGIGELVSFPWPRRGLPLNFLNKVDR
jgi:gluconolactonase